MRRPEPDLGDFDIEDLYDERWGDYSGHRLLVVCPHCARRHRPLASRATETVLRDTDFYVYRATCHQTRRTYRLTVFSASLRSVTTGRWPYHAPAP